VVVVVGVGVVVSMAGLGAAKVGAVNVKGV
jgi:hypothetical protein